MVNEAKFTDAYVTDRAIADIANSGGHRSRGLDEDTKSLTPEFSGFDLSVGSDVCEGTQVFWVDGTVDVAYTYQKYVPIDSVDSYELKEWAESHTETYEIYYYVAEGKLIEGEP